MKEVEKLMRRTENGMTVVEQMQREIECTENGEAQGKKKGELLM